jgi:hypothetical protein
MSNYTITRAMLDAGANELMNTARMSYEEQAERTFMVMLEKKHKDTNAFLEFLLDRAEEIRANAGYGGERDDGGASKLIAEVDVFKAGQCGLIPARWYDLHQQYLRANDPEYADYVRLKQKFEGK